MPVQFIKPQPSPATQELAITRGWIMAELNKRLGDDLFDEWLMTDSDAPNPLAFFESKGK